MSKPCIYCSATGFVTNWNLRDDSGDGIEVCGECGGYGYINDDSLS